MTIRARLTAWYAGIMFVSLLTMGALLYYHFVALPRHRARHGLMSAGQLAEEAVDFGDVAQIVLWSGLPSALLALAGGWWLTRQALSPVARLTQAAQRINERNLRERLPSCGGGDELERLTQVFNAMTARLDDSFQRVRDFTLHASHELKTPLTVLRGELETALREESGHSPAQRERLLSQIDEIERLTKIVDGLTLLTKADAGQVGLHLEALRLDELFREAFADANILAQPARIQVLLTACDQTTLLGDRHRLRQLLLNLTDNAVKYNQPNGTVTLCLRNSGNVAELQVANTGAGLAPQLQSRVFERFFRGDHSHGTAIEGCGLGLSIAQWIATAHHGTIRFVSQPGGLTTVTVRLPRDATCADRQTHRTESPAANAVPGPTADGDGLHASP
jgi:signal transduction histidine kinase